MIAVFWLAVALTVALVASSILGAVIEDQGRFELENRVGWATILSAIGAIVLWAWWGIYTYPGPG